MVRVIKVAIGILLHVRDVTVNAHPARLHLLLCTCSHRGCKFTASQPEVWFQHH